MSKSGVYSLLPIGGSISISSRNESTNEICKGSLISPRAVLTAAHCVKTINESDIIVRSQEKIAQEIDVEAVIIHEQFMTTTLYNDVALLILKKSFTKTKNVSTICLIQLNTDKFNASNCKNSNSELAQIVTEKDCQKQLRKTQLGSQFVLEQSFLCANHKKNKNGLMEGPLICQNLNKPGRYFQVGIFSWSLKDSNLLSIYNDVGKMRYWIDEKMSLMGLHKISYISM